MRVFTAAILSLCLAGGAWGAEGTISTLAGSKVEENAPALLAPLANVNGIAADNVGNVYFSDAERHVIRRVDKGTGLISTVAGAGGPGFYGDGGPALQARFNNPNGLSYYFQRLFVADQDNDRIRMIDLSTGIVTTVAGNGVPGFSGDGGPAILAQLKRPASVSFDGSAMWIADTLNDRLRRVTAGMISTAAGGGFSGGPLFGDNGPGPSASLRPLAVFNPVFNLGYALDSASLRVRRVISDSPYTITSVAGVYSQGYSGDGGPALAAKLNFSNLTDPTVGGNALAVQPSTGKIFIADYYNGRIRMVIANNITTVAGGGSDLAEGISATAADLGYVKGVALSGNGDLFILEFHLKDHYYLIRKVDHLTQLITTVAGASPGPGSQPATSMILSYVYSLFGTGGGDFVFSDQYGYEPFFQDRIWRYQASSQAAQSLAGNAGAAWSGDGLTATAASLGQPGPIARDSDGSVYIAENNSDSDFYFIRKVDPNGITSTFAGSGTNGCAGNNGPALLAELNPLGSLALRGRKLYLASAGAIRVIDLDSNSISAFAGLCGVTGYVDGALASARISSNSNAMAFDALGSLYLADSGNHAVRKIDPQGLSMTTVCGLGPFQGGYFGDGLLAKDASLNFPNGLWLNSAGDLFIADTGNLRIRRVDADTGLIETVAGSGFSGYAGDGGPAKMALLSNPGQGFAFGDSIVFADGNHIRKVDFAQSPTPTPVEGREMKVTAYPSPAAERICFSYKAPQAGKAEILVYNAAFQLAARYEETVSAGQVLTCASLSGLAPGAYLYRVSVAGQNFPLSKFKVAR